MTAAPPWTALVIDDDAGIRQSLRLCLESAGAQVLGVGSARAATEAIKRGSYDVILLDLWLGQDSGMDVLPKLLHHQPDAGVIVVTAFATYTSAVEAMRLGATDYLPKPFTPEQVRAAAQRVLSTRRLKQELAELRTRLDGAGPDVEPWFNSESPRFRTFLHQAGRAATSEATLLLRGESGTGKNVLARWISARSHRAAGPFVTVHCPALSKDLMSSTLFGHRKGAFTGAVMDVQGKVAEAKGGTLFLDEVGDLNHDAQARLLRFLNDRTYERLGEATERQADVRILAATNRDLEAQVAEGSFREDLFFRLNVLSLTLPPLRERTEDIVPLARSYLQQIQYRYARNVTPFSLSEAAVQALLAHDWPGNLRELRNAIERATILTLGEIQPEDLGLTRHSAEQVRIGDMVPIQDVEREHIAQVIGSTPTLEAAAKVLGIDATTLQRKRKRYGLM